MSEVKVNKISPRSGTTLTIGDSGDTTNVVGTLNNNGSSLLSLANGVNNRVITSSSATALNGEANLTFDGSTLGVNGAAIFNESGADKDFRVESDGNANMLFVDGGNNTVGIGTSTPPFLLSLSGNSQGISFTDTSGGTNAKAWLMQGLDSDFRLRTQLDNYGGGQVATIITRTAAVVNTHQFYTEDSERMRLTTTGLGIGTSSPQNKLHVTKNVLSGASYRSNAPLIIENSSDTEVQILSGNSGSGQLRFGDGAANFRGGLSYNHGDDSFILATGGANQVTIHSNGVVSAADGIALGVGLLNTASNVLDDYEEGNWTPGVTFGGGNTGVNSGASAGSYTKVGRLVMASGLLLLSSKGSSTGNALLTGLPFTAGSGNKMNGAVSFAFIERISFNEVLTGTVGTDSTTASFFEAVSGNVTSNRITNSDFNNATGLRFTITYQTN